MPLLLGSLMGAALLIISIKSIMMTLIRSSNGADNPDHDAFCRVVTFRHVDVVSQSERSQPAWEPIGAYNMASFTIWRGKADFTASFTTPPLTIM